MKAIIIDSKDRIRRLAADQSFPAALEELNLKRGSSMDWIIHVLQEAGVKDVIYVGGYHIEKVVRKYPFLRFYYQKNWRKGSDVEAFLEVKEELSTPTIVVKSNVIFRKKALDLLFNFRKHSCVVGVVSGKYLSEQEKREFGTINGGKNVYKLRSSVKQPSASKENQYFAGMFYIPAKFASKSVMIARGLHKAGEKSLVSLVDRLEKDGLKVHVVKVDKYWSSLHKSLSLARFVMGTKAQTLERLRPVVKKSVILPHVKFTVKEWEKDAGRIILQIQDICGKKILVVRSSALNEDSWISSQAGKFLSELDVDGNKIKKIAAAVDKVIRSYNKPGFFSKHNQILVQPKLAGVKVSGVLFTKDLVHSAPYYIINYDRKTQKTDTVTSGKGSDLETKIIYRNYKFPLDDGWCDKLVSAAREIEELLAYNALDIEFAIDGRNTIYCLQIRPLVPGNQELSLTDEDFDAEIKKIKDFTTCRFQESPYVLGTTNMLGEMPDWNPVEMIGNSPKPLALSLYQKLITDWAWAEARSRCNYKNVRPEPLMFSLGGKPFIDVRNSFNSLIPSTLSIDLSEKLINYSLEYLRENPEYHDKVEFDVMLNCYDFDFKSKIERLLNSGFKRSETAEIRKCYLRFTNDLIGASNESINKHLKFFEILQERRNKIYNSKNNEIPWLINGLLHDCIEYGIIPFSILARYAFIAMILLRTLVKKGVFTNNEYETFLRNIPTVATQFNQDLILFQSGKLNKEDFIDKYGHLRPNSYDICSLNYSLMLEKGIFSNSSKQYYDPDFAGSLRGARKIWESKEGNIRRILKENGFTASTDQVFNFITQTLPAREKGKFEFTKNLNLILGKITFFGSELGFNREDMSYLSIEKIIQFATASPPSVIKSEFERTINYEKKRYALTRSLRLPSLIDSPKDIECFDLLEGKPNFITGTKVNGKVVNLSSSSNPKDLTGKIILIQGADPGYEWIFSKSIAGLITQYGGSGSHMAIRAAEFSIPAAIGCGDIIFNKVRKSQFVELDCGSQTIRTKL